MTDTAATTGTIVVGVDGSDDGDAALSQAATLAAQTNQSLVAVFVRHLPVFIEASSALGEALRALDEMEASIHEKVKATLDDRGVSWEFVTREGDPASQLIAVADERDASLIVVGHRGMNRAMSILLGSVASRLVHHADRSVLIAR